MKLIGKKRDFDYFACFCGNAQLACKAANHLHESLKEFSPALLREYTDIMHKIENDADMSKHELTRHLLHEFITPIEREDIIALAQEMDNVVDSIDDVMRHMYMFNVRAIRPEALEFTELICKCCVALHKAVVEFPHFRKSNCINDYIIEVNNCESAADVLQAEYVRKLFTDDTDARDVMIWVTLFERLESCLDACEHTTDIIESVILKNS